MRRRRSGAAWTAAASDATASATVARARAEVVCGVRGGGDDARFGARVEDGVWRHPRRHTCAAASASGEIGRAHV